MAYETENLLYGSTRNPWNLDYTPGGSSGGEAAAIAAGLSAGGLGSDSGGSVREPAHFTGICALKPTAGRIPAAGHLPPCLGPFSFLGSIGPMARTVGDLASACSRRCPVRIRLIRAALLSRIAPSRSRRQSVFRLDGSRTMELSRSRRRRAPPCSTRRGRWSGRGSRVKPFRPKSLEAARKLWWTFFVQCGAMLYAPTIRGHEDELSSDLSRFSGDCTCRAAAHGRFAARSVG